MARCQPNGLPGNTPKTTCLTPFAQRVCCPPHNEFVGRRAYNTRSGEDLAERKGCACREDSFHARDACPSVDTLRRSSRGAHCLCDSLVDHAKSASTGKSNVLDLSRPHFWSCRCRRCRAKRVVELMALDAAYVPNYWSRNPVTR